MGKITAKKSKTYFRIFLLNPSSPAEGRWQPSLAPGTRPPSLSLRHNPSSVPRPCQFLSSVPLTCAPHGRTQRGTRWLTAMAGDPRRKVWAQTRRRAWAVDTLRPDDAQKALGTGRALGSPCGYAGACSRADGRLPQHEQSKPDLSEKAPATPQPGTRGLGSVTAGPPPQSPVPGAASLTTPPSAWPARPFPQQGGQSTLTVCSPLIYKGFGLKSPGVGLARVRATSSKSPRLSQPQFPLL